MYQCNFKQYSIQMHPDTWRGIIWLHWCMQMASVEKSGQIILSMWHITGRTKMNNVISLGFPWFYYLLRNHLGYILCAHFQYYFYITVNITDRNNSAIFCQQKVSHLIWYAFQIQHSSFLMSGMDTRTEKQDLEYHYKFQRQTLSVITSNSFLL
jgi:hypothetical protein